MKDWIRYCLYFLNVLLYIGITAIWIANPGDMTLNMAITAFNLSFSLMLLYWDRERFSHLYKSSAFSNFVSCLISVFWIFCIIALLNYLSFKHPFQIDVTETKMNSLTVRGVMVVVDRSVTDCRIGSS